MLSSLLSIAVVATAATSFAPAPATTTQLQKITVTAPTGTPQALDETLAPVLVIGREQIAAFVNTDIASLLRFHAGLDIARNGGPGQPVSLFLRGTGSAHTLVRVDGIRVNPGSIGGPPLTNIRTAGIARIEVVEAPRSALYGSDAIGGVVDITFHRPPRNGFDAGVSVSGGHYSSRGASAHAGGGNGTFFGGAMVSFFETDGFPTKTASDQASAYRNLTLHAGFGVQGEAGEARATIWRSAGTTNYLDFFLNPRSADYTNRVVSTHLSRRMNDRWESRIIAGQFYYAIEQVQNDDYTHTWRNSLDWRNDIALGEHHLLSAGLFLAHQHVNALSFGTHYDQTTSNQAIYLQDQMNFGPHRVVLAGRETDFTSFGNQFTWNAAWGFNFAHSRRLVVGTGTGFRAPTATDRFGFGGNPDLKPEQSHSYNVGLFQKFSPHARMGLNIYRNHVTDLIAFQATSSGGQVQNIGSATITGVNLSAHLAFGPWHIAPAVNFQRPLNDETGGYLPRRTRKSATLNLAYDTGIWRLGAHFLAAGPTEDSDFNDQVNAGYLLTTLTASIEFAPRWTLRARIENLFDVHYQTAAGFASPGRGLYLALSYAL